MFLCNFYLGLLLVIRLIIKESLGVLYILYKIYKKLVNLFVWQKKEFSFFESNKRGSKKKKQTKMNYFLILTVKIIFGVRIKKRQLKIYKAIIFCNDRRLTYVKCQKIKYFFE